MCMEGAYPVPGPRQELQKWKANGRTGTQVGPLGGHTGVLVLPNHWSIRDTKQAISKEHRFPWAGTKIGPREEPLLFKTQRQRGEACQPQESLGGR